MTHQDPTPPNDFLLEPDDPGRREALLGWYRHVGMRLVPVYELLEDGTCACGNECDPRSRGKHPRLGDWRRQASADPAVVQVWHGRWPTTNWAWVLDDHFVVDSDPRNGGFAPDAFYDDWEEHLGFVLPPTRSATTGGGGVHAVFAQPSLGEVRSGKLWLDGRALRGLEVKGVGGYVLVEPSNHTSGRRYRWWGFDEPADPTPELLALRSRRGSGPNGHPSQGPESSRLSDGQPSTSSGWGDGERFDWSEALTPGAVPPGDQQTTLYRAAASCRARRKSDDEALELLYEVVGCFRDGDPSNPWRPEAAQEIWERAKVELPEGSPDQVGIVREFRPHLTLVRGDGSDEDEDPAVGDAGDPGGRGPGDAEAGAASPGDEPPFGRNTDRDNAEELVHRYGDRIMFTPGQGWWTWDGVRWNFDVLQLTWEYCRRVADRFRLLARPGDEGELLRARAHKLDMTAGIKATLSYASSLVGRQDEELDSHPTLLNCPNGVLDLTTGRLQEHDPNLRLTRLTGVDFEPDARSDLLDEYLATFVPDEDHQEALWRLLGACLAGGNEARLLLLFVGGTTSGKSQLASGVERALGDYAGVGNASVFRGNLDDKPRPDIMKLLTCRLALMEEAGQSWELHGDRIKHMTGGGTVSVRGMQSNVFVEREPQFTPLIIANELPRVKGADLATYRRLKVVPFRYTPATEDPLKKTQFLRDERTRRAVLAQVVAGHLRYRFRGLDDLPVEFEVARAYAYDALDDVVEFLRYAEDQGLLTRSQQPAQLCAKSSDLHLCYTRWVKRHGDATQRRDQLSLKSFSMRLTQLGWVSQRSQGTRWVGWELRDPTGWLPS